MLIQFHVLQNYAPANLNRDDTGSPKDARFGDHLRGRISSQCLKRSIRRSAIFTDAFKAKGLLGDRTRQLPQLIRNELEKLDASTEERKAIIARVPEIGKKSAKATDDTEEDETSTENQPDSDIGETRQLIFIGANETKPIAENLLSLYRTVGAKAWKKADLKKALGRNLPKSVDIALFGRMTTDEAFEDVHAASQVAHAISTNALEQEYDYYTGVDDISGQAGASMIGDVEYNSSTYYKYFNIHWEELVANLGGDTAVAREAVLAFLEASIFAQPSGKQNSFAAYNLPDLVLVEVGTRNVPVNYANAFLTPATPTETESIVEVSAQMLAKHVNKLTEVYSLKVERSLLTTLGDHSANTIAGAVRHPNLKALSMWLAGQIDKGA